MILHEVRIPYKYGDEFKLKPLFDAHIGDVNSDTKAIKEYLSVSDDKTYLLFGGDTAACITPGDIRRYMKEHDATKGSDIFIETANMVKSFIDESYKGNILGVMMGNHESTALKYNSFHVSRCIAEKLNTTSLGMSCVIRLRFEEKGQRVRTVMIYAHHGWGGGSRTAGADITKYAKHTASWNCDIFLYGHVHRLQTDKIDRMDIVGNKLVSKPKYLYICGTFQKTLNLTDVPTYAEEKGYPPVSIGAPTITIRPNKHWVTIESDIG